ncbi:MULTISPECIES: glycosyltransferase family 2 protein [unclassified Curtobacterium]|jgi:glycosyltransferase involved in cell wall biosynthesis|uniref:glycosyltransferase family 2 protein n=1 Tax=unclassified Curtobacterium TaxID=257496 RepID=UPI000F47A914|nr:MULTISPECIES: glycosyltransferase family 2 protein [unclassified Curtobacterium]NQW90919.1 glycosyltransferase family 2 protein [Curtobacterium sp. VKM Ac-2861]ROS35425.1 cellulose synthase/poly-beta-1,6-N-acetylglucosamine synthase-like glycosyltransferase [Curtobacterium sp. PhB78]RPE79365.1 cellulose synthase/poly-beta-1,6-N-acetylglucosamine synthase-like glycosyltransferase [Curtobacterium sp. PhB137]TCL78049.1 cellulose synthase/poly-beta-1,6-N-acetylglucosamine synthase-like glycosylt
MQTDGQPLPGVSYVMPVLNEVTEVRAAVASLLDQDYTGVFEVILALGPSIDGTNELVAEMSAADPRIRAIDNPVGSTPAGLNVAITASVHPVVVRVDAHSVLPPDYTRIAVRTLLESGADNVGGIMRAEGRSPFERAVALAYGSRVGLGGTPHHVGGTAGPAETAYLGVFRRDRLFEVGLFDEGIKRGQDWELNRRLRQTGGTVWFTPELVVTYRPRPSLKRLVRQFVATGLWRGELARRFPANNGLRYFVPPAMVAAMAVGILAGVVGVVGAALGSPVAWALLGFAVPAVYLLFVVLGSVAVARRSGVATFLWLLVVLPCIHVGWGLGFIIGFLTRTSELTTHTGR